MLVGIEGKEATQLVSDGRLGSVLLHIALQGLDALFVTESLTLELQLLSINQSTVMGIRTAFCRGAKDIQDLLMQRAKGFLVGEV